MTEREEQHSTPIATLTEEEWESIKRKQKEEHEMKEREWEQWCQYDPAVHSVAAATRIAGDAEAPDKGQGVWLLKTRQCPDAQDPPQPKDKAFYKAAFFNGLQKMIFF